MGKNQDAVEFLRELETRRGGKIKWKTYSTWFSDCTNVREFGVFLYEIDGILYYEDFERKPSILGFELPKRKNAPEYIKLEGSFMAADVVNVYKLSKSRAVSYLHNQERTRLLRPASAFDRFFRQTVSIVKLRDGSKLFFEFLDEKQFKRIIAKHAAKEEG